MLGQFLKSVLFILAFHAPSALAARKIKIAPEDRAAMISESNSSSGGASSFSKGSYKQMMFADLSANYMRDADTVTSSDTGLRLNLTGMFNEWIGLGGSGLFGLKSQSYLLSADVRFMPTDWFYAKGGLGGYSDKRSGSFRGTPIVGGGFIARFNPDFYFVADMTYFKANKDNMISFGAGVGVIF